ncbi:hypothetical protein VNO77_19107 [Canavalia gladiata]|uniref:Uncharacterized protein n=1 Tax=Canavalia gladiata TaxID=3824 RepID=A0AAN9QL27_CANGL
MFREELGTIRENMRRDISEELAKRLRKKIGKNLRAIASKPCLCFGTRCGDTNYFGSPFVRPVYGEGTMFREELGTIREDMRRDISEELAKRLRKKIGKNLRGV